MTRESDEKLGKVFSFDTEKPGGSAAETDQRDETFTIPAFLRRTAKTKEPEPVPIWEDDDFARIAATAESPKSMDEPTTVPPEAPGSLKEKEPDVKTASPTVVDVSEVEPAAAQIPVTETEESTLPLRLEEPNLSAAATDDSPATPPAEVFSIEAVIPVAETVTEPFRPVSQPRAENAEIHIPPVLSAAIPREAAEERAEPVLFSKPQIRIEPRENIEQGFERREPRLGPVEPSGEMPARAHASWRGEDFRSDAPTEDDDRGRWRLGPALDARDIDAFGTPIIEDDEWEREEKASPIRWVVLALAVAAGGYAVAHQLDTGGSLTASLPFMKAQEQVADFASSAAPSTIPANPAATAAPSVQIPPASKPETASRFVPAAKVAHAAPPAQPVATPKPAPQEKVASAEDTARAASEAPHETETPVTLAPGPRTLSAPPAVQARGDAVATGELLLDVQQRLTRLGYANVPLNGRLDASTRAAIMSFQRNSGLGMTGLIDSTFLDNLRHTSPVGMRLVKGPDAIVPR